MAIATTCLKESLSIGANKHNLYVKSQDIMHLNLALSSF